MRAALALAVVCLMTPGVIAGPVFPVDISTRARGADRIVAATIVDVRASFETSPFGDQLIVSHVMLRIEETLKGNPSDMLPFDLEGGTVGNLTLNVSDLPQLQTGQRGVFFLHRLSSGVYVPHLRGLGILGLDAADRVPGSSLTLGSIRNLVAAAR